MEHSTKSIRVGLLGAGGINSHVADCVLAGGLPGIQIVAVAGSSASSETATALAEKLGACAVGPEQLANVGCNWVVEAAGGAALRAHMPALWLAGVNTVVMSVGAMIDDDVRAEYDAALARGVQVKLPSGGIAGLDGVRALAAGGGLRSVRITTTKSPRGLRGAPHLERNNIVLPDDEVVTAFEGSAREAVAGFPANVNVAIALSLAGLGPDRTQVKVISDPSTKLTKQLIEAEGDAASLEIRIATRPSPSNPRTSYLAGASAVAALADLRMTG